MASKSLFRGAKGVSAKSPAADTKNEAGGLAYSLKAKEALAQLAATGCFNNTFYAKAEDQLTKVKELTTQCDPEFIGKLALYSREKGFLKDMPAFLVATLSGRVAEAHKVEEILLQQRAALRTEKRDVPVSLEAQIAAAHEEVERLNEIVWAVFPRVIDNGKMLKNFVQIVRSGEAGRKSLGTAPRRLIRSWFDTKTDEQVFFQSIGNDPSLGDIVSLVHPHPMTRERAALFGYLLDKTAGKFEGNDFVVSDAIPSVVADYERFKKEPQGETPKVPFEMLEGLPLSVEQWQELALRQSWQSLRQRLNLFNKKGAFKSADVVKAVAAKLADAQSISKARALPYQLLVAYLNMNAEMPREITNALQDAMEIATKNVPTVDDVVVIMPDISGSMHSPITGMQMNPKTGRVEQHTSKVRCIDVAAVIAASMLRVNPHAVIIPFESKALTDVRLNPRDSIMTNAQKLTALPCGGTNCSAALAAITTMGIRPALAMYVSDNESWMDSPRYGNWGGSRTETLRQWDLIKKGRSDARLVCNDVQPNTTSPAPSRNDILNVGGFSDQVFEVVKSFHSGSASSWVEVIESMT
jgi:60 kDa SS-A/Ro ribonucleoprotein